MSLPEFHQTFEAAAAQTSGLLKQVLSPQTIFFLVRASVYLQTGGHEPAVLIARLLGLGSKLYPSNMQRTLNKDLTRFIQSLSRVR